MEVTVGMRVAQGAQGKPGTVRYVGPIADADGEWVGVELDRPEGKHDGSLHGVVYFRCVAPHGVFVRQSNLKPLTDGTAAASRGVARMSMGGTAASRLQRDRDRERRASGVGGTATPVPAVASRFGYTAGRQITPPRGAQDAAARRTLLHRTPSASASGSASALTSPAPVEIPSGALVEARSRIAQLEEAMEEKDRHLAQMQQNVMAMRATQQRARAAESKDDMEVETEMEMGEDAPLDDRDEGGEDEARMMEIEQATRAEEAAAHAEQIDAVRQKANERVEQARQQLESHLARVQSDFDEQLDELRLENAAQSSEIKSLEAEVTQQKARIAQFTAAEQKRAEEMALTAAKTSAGARKLESLEAQVAELQDMVETATLEKETLEMDKEIAEERVEELQAEIEKMRTTMALSAVSERAAAMGTSTDVMEENMKLRAAIKALHDRSSDEKNELNRKLRQLQREHTELEALREEVEQLTAKKRAMEGEMEELKEMLDISNAYESMVEEITEKNLNLGEKVAELETTVISLESLKEMSEEMEHQHTEYEAELTREVESQRGVNQGLKQTVSELKTIIEDRDRTITRFRDVVTRGREEIEQLKTLLRAGTGELESLKGTAHNALSQTMNMRALAASAREFEAEAAKQKINADQARLENVFLRAAVPLAIFSDADQKGLRVRLCVGRISGKTDILLRNLRKELEINVSEETKDANSFTLLDSERCIQQLLLGEKLATLSYQAKEDLYLLECHLTTAEEYSAACDRLDSASVTALESVLDAALTAFAEGTICTARTGETSVYQRLLSCIGEWDAIRATVATTEGFPLRCAVVKFRARKCVQSLVFLLGVMLMFVQTLKAFVASPECLIADDTKSRVVSLLDQVISEIAALLHLAQNLHRRAEIDLTWNEEDVDGAVAVGGDVVELTYAYATECQSLWGALQERLSMSSLQSQPTEEVASFIESSLLVMLSSFKERLAGLFNSVCRGSIVEAVASRSRARGGDLDVGGHEGRAQWKIRAQAIHNALLDASALQSNLNEMNELCQALHSRVRDLERADGQHRVVTQKLESEVLQLNNSLEQSGAEKTHLEEQLTREREQFALALDESHKEKASLDNLNRELRKQLKRSNDQNASAGASTSRSTAALSQGDAEAFRNAFNHLHAELFRVRCALAKERIDAVLGRPVAVKSRLVSSDNGGSSEQIVKCSKDIAQFARHVKAHVSMPKLIDLSKRTASTMTDKLERAKMKQTLSKLREELGVSIEAAGWSREIANSVRCGEQAFGWQPPEAEHPPVLLGRLTLRMPSDGDQVMDDGRVHAPVPLVLDQTQVNQLNAALTC